jgi:hypothetical protein
MNSRWWIAASLLMAIGPLSVLGCGGAPPLPMDEPAGQDLAADPDAAIDAKEAAP